MTLDGKLQQPTYEFDKEDVRYNHRFAPFGNLITPPPVQYTHFKVNTDYVFYVITQSHIYTFLIVSNLINRGLTFTILLLLSVYCPFSDSVELPLDMITFLLHFFLSWMSSLPISSSAISTYTFSNHVFLGLVVVVVDLPLLRVAVEVSDNPISLEKPCQASLPPDQQGHHSFGRHPEVQYPGLDSMSPARSRRSASHAAGTHGWLPQKNGRPGLRRGGVGG